MRFLQKISSLFIITIFFFINYLSRSGTFSHVLLKFCNDKITNINFNVSTRKDYLALKYDQLFKIVFIITHYEIQRDSFLICHHYENINRYKAVRCYYL